MYILCIYVHIHADKNTTICQIVAICNNMINMAEVTRGDVMRSGVQLQDSSSYINGNCVNCVLMNDKYQEASVELKSLRLINSMLHEEIKTLRNQQDALREE
jgi:hypothetical protein